MDVWSIGSVTLRMCMCWRLREPLDTATRSRFMYLSTRNSVTLSAFTTLVATSITRWMTSEKRAPSEINRVTDSSICNCGTIIVGGVGV